MCNLAILIRKTCTKNSQCVSVSNIYQYDWCYRCWRVVSMHENSECLDPCWLLSCLGNFWPSGGQKHSKGGVSRAPSQRHMRFEFHQNQVSASEEFSGLFIRPFEKRKYYAMAMSVRPSVRPSVRVFRTFFQRALRYQFETWYMHSVGGTTCRVWVSSQLGHFDLVYSQK